MAVILDGQDSIAKMNVHMDFLESGAVTLVDIAFIRQHVTMLLESVNKGVSQGIKHQAVPKLVKGECTVRIVAHPVETVWSQSNVITLTEPV